MSAKLTLESRGQIFLGVYDYSTDSEAELDSGLLSFDVPLISDFKSVSMTEAALQSPHLSPLSW